MDKPYQAVILDWEGTIGDSLGQILNCLKTEAQRLHFGEVDEALARRSVDLGLVNALRKIFPNLRLDEQEKLLEAIQQALMSRHSEVFLLEGAKSFIESLYQRNVPLAIATNKGKQGLKHALAATDLAKYIHTTRTAAETAPKPSPQMLKEILEEWGLSPRQAVMVGDSESDIIMAKSIGMQAIGVNFYHQDNTALLDAGAIAVFDNYQALLDFLDPLLHSSTI